MLINEPLVIFQPAAALTTTAVQCLLHAALVEESVIMTATARTVMDVDLKIVRTFIPLYQRKVHVVRVSKSLLFNDPDNLNMRSFWQISLAFNLIID